MAQYLIPALLDALVDDFDRKVRFLEDACKAVLQEGRRGPLLVEHASEDDRESLTDYAERTLAAIREVRERRDEGDTSGAAAAAVRVGELMAEVVARFDWPEVREGRRVRNARPRARATKLEQQRRLVEEADDVGAKDDLNTARRLLEIHAHDLEEWEHTPRVRGFDGQLTTPDPKDPSEIERAAGSLSKRIATARKATADEE